ncbi:hypothetical protein C8Q76DRAFT_792887 [Earliella scabrosa]|nr:hypothetical protein C8Q76DRAFT_792887 [Earliella scabrosa]
MFFIHLFLSTVLTLLGTITSVTLDSRVILVALQTLTLPAPLQFNAPTLPAPAYIISSRTVPLHHAYSPTQFIPLPPLPDGHFLKLFCTGLILSLVIFGSLAMLVRYLRHRELQNAGGPVYILHTNYSNLDDFWIVPSQPMATHPTPSCSPTVYGRAASVLDPLPAALEDPSIYVKAHRLDDVQPLAHYGQTVRCYYTPVDSKAPLPPVYSTLVSMGVVRFDMDRRLVWTAEYFDEFVMHPDVIDNVTSDYTAWDQEPHEHVVVCQLPDSYIGTLDASDWEDDDSEPATPRRKYSFDPAVFGEYLVALSRPGSPIAPGRG